MTSDVSTSSNPKLATAQQFLLLVVFSAILVAIGSAVVVAGDLTDIVPMPVLATAMGLFQLMACLAVVRAFNALFPGKSGGLVLMLLALVPVVSLIVLLALNQVITKRLKSAGDRVGILGARTTKKEASNNIAMVFVAWAIVAIVALTLGYLDPDEGIPSDRSLPQDHTLRPLQREK